MGNSLHASGRKYASRRARGFTLLERMVVLMIIGMLVGYLGPQYVAQIGQSKVKAARSRINALVKATDQLRPHNRHDTNTVERLAALVQRPANEAGWAGPYPSKVLHLGDAGRA